MHPDLDPIAVRQKRRCAVPIGAVSADPGLAETVESLGPGMPVLAIGADGDHGKTRRQGFQEQRTGGVVAAVVRHLEDFSAQGNSGAQ
jgi:hypothetical protein